MDSDHRFDQLPHLTPVTSTITAISDQAMHLIWNRTPTEFLKEAIPRLLMMRCAPYTPQALIIIKCTGGSKSVVAQTIGCVDYGVTLIIVETLALAADQLSKILSANGLYGPLLVYQLDSIKRKDLVTKL